MRRTVTDGTIIALNCAGYSKKRIAEILGIPVVAVRRALRGQASLSVARERQEGETAQETFSVATPRSAQLRTPIPYADDTDPPHGPVRQLMRDGKPCNEIVWRPE